MNNRNVLRLLAVLIFVDLVWLVLELFPGLLRGLGSGLVQVLDFTRWSHLGWLAFFFLMFAFALGVKIYPDFKDWISTPPSEKQRPTKRPETDKLSPALKKQLDDRRRFGR